MTFKEFVSEANAYYRRNKPHLRKGQAYVNYFNSLEPKMVIPGKFDCFFLDILIPLFLEWAEENWNDQAEYRTHWLDQKEN